MSFVARINNFGLSRWGGLQIKHYHERSGFCRSEPVPLRLELCVTCKLASESRATSAHAHHWTKGAESMCGPSLGHVLEISFDESASYFLGGVIVELITIVTGIDFCLPDLLRLLWGLS